MKKKTKRQQERQKDDHNNKISLILTWFLIARNKIKKIQSLVLPYKKKSKRCRKVSLISTCEVHARRDCKAVRKRLFYEFSSLLCMIFMANFSSPKTTITSSHLWQTKLFFLLCLIKCVTFLSTKKKKQNDASLNWRFKIKYVICEY